MTQLDALTPDQHRQRYEELKAQARARAAARPAQSAVVSAPVAIPEDAVIRHEIIPDGWYATFRLPRWQSLRIVNPAGTPGVSALLWNADDTSERYNAGDTVKLQWNALLTKGQVLFSDMGRVLASITEDTSGQHDTIVGGSVPRPGDGAVRNTRDNFRLAAAKLGLGRPDIHPCITFFAPVRVDTKGRLEWYGEAPRTGTLVELRAEMNLLVVLSNSPHPMAPAGSPVAPAEVTVWRSPPPGPDDVCRNFTEEAIRGFENTDPLFRA